jgi:hypothetical protein
MKRHPHVRCSDDDHPLVTLRGSKQSIALPASEAEALMRPAGILARARFEAMLAEQEARTPAKAKRQA